ncbi:MAG: hypothetical protein GC147_12805 [Porphyrobacter sp.]|nr:hypothetical protein [Porphyrobacter sp.]
MAAPAAARESVAITIVGKIEPSCRLGLANNTLDVGSLDSGGSARIGFDLDCNTPFQMSVASRNGGLAAGYEGPVTGAFERSVAYRAELVMPLDDGSQIETQCDSEALAANAACGLVSSGLQTAIAQSGSLTVAWQASSQPRLAGDYSDVITVTVEFAP